MFTKRHTSDFERLFLFAVCLLSVCCVILALCNIFDKPRLRRYELDTVKVTQQANQRMILYVNQPITPVTKQSIHIDPVASYNLTSSGSEIILVFNERLRYNTEYTIRINDVTASRGRHKAQSFATSFRTGADTFFYIKRNYGIDPSGLFGVKQEDQILSDSISKPNKKVVYSAEKILDYVVLGDKLVVATLNDDKTSNVISVDLKTNEEHDYPLPKRGQVSNLRASLNGRLFGFTFTSMEETNKQYDGALFNVDTQAHNLMYQILGLDGKQLLVVDWKFAPDGTTIVACAVDGSAFLVDTTSKFRPEPLGQYYGVDSFSYNGQQAVFENNNGPVIVDLLTYQRTYPTISSEEYVSTVQLLQNSVGSIYMTDHLDYDSNEYTQSLFAVRDKSVEKLLSIDVKQESLDYYFVSPNDQYLAVERHDTQHPEADDYIGQYKPKSVSTKIIDKDSKKQIKEVDGFKIIWR